MKVFLLINNFGGLKSFRKEVVSAIIDKGYDVYISGPIDGNADFFVKLGCKLIDTQFNRKGVNPLKDISLMFFYAKILHRIKPDIVLSYTIKPNLYGGMACQLCKIPQIANITGLGSAVENTGWLQKITILLYKVGLRKTHTVFCQNNANMNFCLHHKMVKGHMKLIPGSGVNLTFHCLQHYPSPNEPIRFIFISRLMREKGVDEYLGAAVEIKKKYPDVEFHILGNAEENYVAKVEELQKEGYVIYHGRQSDVRPFIGKVHCTIHPSFYPEGMSNVLLESCAAGRPIITTGRPGCGEIVDDGINGYVVRERDCMDVVAKIEKFIQLPYEQKCQMGMAARRKVEKEFDRNIVVQAYMDEISEVIHG